MAWMQMIMKMEQSYNQNVSLETMAQNSWKDNWCFSLEQDAMIYSYRCWQSDNDTTSNVNFTLNIYCICIYHSTHTASYRPNIGLITSPSVRINLWPHFQKTTTKRSYHNFWLISGIGCWRKVKPVLWRLNWKPGNNPNRIIPKKKRLCSSFIFGRRQSLCPPLQSE